MKELQHIFYRTLDNCLFYEKENKPQHLLNEIGCLRGIAYALEAFDICPYTNEFMRLIAIQNKLLASEKESRR